jgi:hypothetical protein
MPLFILRGSAFMRSKYVSVTITAQPPAAAARVVLTAAFAASKGPCPSRVPTATQLNPYHPNHRNIVPAVWKTGDCMGSNIGIPALNLPTRGPTTTHAMSAANPPVTCTTKAPA